MIPSSYNPLINAARAIAVAAYPNTKDHVSGGRAEKYSIALLANIVRISRDIGYSDTLPQWARDVRVEAMNGCLLTGFRSLMRSLTIRDLISSSLIMKSQYDRCRNGQSATFTMQYAPDLQSMTIVFPFKNTVSGYLLNGKVPETKLASLRAAILYHQPALQKFQGPAVKSVGHDSELTYQNTYNRYVRPALFAQHIVQVVWESVVDAAKEAAEREISVDELLMRKPDWAANIHIKTADGLGVAIHKMRELGIPTCWCEMVKFGEPLPDS